MELGQELHAEIVNTAVTAAEIFRVFVRISLEQGQTPHQEDDAARRMGRRIPDGSNKDGFDHVHFVSIQTVGHSDFSIVQAGSLNGGK